MANSTKRTRFSRRLPDHVTDELVNALTIKKTYEFNSLFEAVYEQLKLRNAVSGGEEMLRLRAYEKLQNLVSRGLVEKIGKTYRGLEGVQNARTPVMPPNISPAVIIPMPVSKVVTPITVLKAPVVVTKAPVAIAKAPATIAKKPVRKAPAAATKRPLIAAKPRVAAKAAKAAKAAGAAKKTAKPISRVAPTKAASAAKAKVGSSKVSKVSARKYK